VFGRAFTIVIGSSCCLLLPCAAELGPSQIRSLVHWFIKPALIISRPYVFIGDDSYLFSVSKTDLTPEQFAGDSRPIIQSKDAELWSDVCAR